MAEHPFTPDPRRFSSVEACSREGLKEATTIAVQAGLPYCRDAVFRGYIAGLELGLLMSQLDGAWTAALAAQLRELRDVMGTGALSPEAFRQAQVARVNALKQLAQQIGRDTDGDAPVPPRMG